MHGVSYVAPTCKLTYPMLPVILFYECSCDNDDDVVVWVMGSHSRVPWGPHFLFAMGLKCNGKLKCIMSFITVDEFVVIGWVNLSRWWHDTVLFGGFMVSGFWVGAIFWREEFLVLCSTFSAGARNRRTRMRDIVSNVGEVGCTWKFTCLFVRYFSH